jgi:CubicO group peptidase (beta-lactamase class C family)
MTLQLENLQAYTEQALTTYNLPAISIAVWRDGQLHEAASGCLNLNTGVEATTDSIFQIGSITKVMTACLIVKLVEQGRLQLDTPVQKYMQDFMLADNDAARRITVRQLINHSSGIAGDFFPNDDGHQGNLIARFVDRCSFLPVIHPIGEMFSYSNTGFGIAGRLVEVITGLSWFQAMEQMIFQPLGMDHAIVNPAEAIRFRTAMGHVYQDDQCQVAEHTYLPLGMSPVGSVATMRPKDLITFARAHLAGGEAANGQAWLSPESVRAMQAPQVPYPSASMVSEKSAGLGWQITDDNASGTRFINHGGATCGSLAMLQLVPEQNAAYAILMNGFKGEAIRETVLDINEAVTGVNLREPALQAANISAERLQAVVGDYECLDSLIQVRLDEAQNLSAHITMNIDPVPPETVQLQPLTDSCFAMVNAKGKHTVNLAFVDGPDGRPQYLFNGGRLSERLPSA